MLQNATEIAEPTLLLAAGIIVGAAMVQGFFQNLTMLIEVGSYTFAASQHAAPVITMLGLGLLVFIATFLVSLHLPDNQT